MQEQKASFQTVRRATEYWLGIACLTVFILALSVFAYRVEETPGRIFSVIFIGGLTWSLIKECRNIPRKYQPDALPDQFVPRAY